MRKIIYIAFALLMSVSLQAQIDRSARPQAGESPKINLGRTQEFTLPNGLKVIVVENHKLPRVTFSLVLDNPPSLEGNIKGVDNLASSMLGNGTSKMSKDEFNEKLDFYGAYLSFSIHSIRGNTLSKYFPEVLKMVAQGALDPVFTQEELDSERSKLLDGIKVGENDPSEIASRVRGVLLYGKDHPRGEYLSEQTINKITLQDVRNYYSQYFVPQNAYLMIVGDVKFDEVKKLVTSDFSSWKKGTAPKANYKDPVNINSVEIDFVDAPNAVQSQVSVNNLVNLKMTDSDYFAALLANHILGGGTDGYLFLNLREARGFTYGSYSRISGSKYVSDFSATAEVRNAVTDSAVVEILKEIKRIKTELPTQENLALAKAKYIGSFVMNTESPQTAANYALQQKTQSLPADFYENYIKNINAVTLEQVQAAAKKYFLDHVSRIVVVGKASEVLPNLEKLGIPINYFDKYGNPTTKPEQKTVSSDVTAKTVLEKYINAIGGKENLEKIKTISMTLEGEMQGQKLTLSKLSTAKGENLTTMTVMGMTMMKSVFNGKTGYVESQGQRKEMTDDEIAEALVSASICPELSLLNSSTIKLKGIENVNGSDAYCLADGDKSYFYDVNTGLKLKESVKKEVAPGQVMDIATNYSDYKDFSDVKFPTVIQMNMGVELKFTLVDLKLNEEIPAGSFD